MLPVLRSAGQSPSVPLSTVITKATADLDLPDSALKERFWWSAQPVVEARVECAAHDLAVAGLVTREEAHLRVTDRGAHVLSDPPKHIDRSYLERFTEYRAYREEVARRRGA